MKIGKLLMVGAFALSTTTWAAENNDTSHLKQDITANLNAIIKSQMDKGYLTRKAEIDVQIFPFRKTAKNLATASPEDELPEADMKETEFNIKNAVCQLALSFDEKGGSPYFGIDQSLRKATVLQNEVQKEMMRQFVALHEHYHCEFANIDQAIKIEGKSADFNQKVNYYAKDMISLMMPNNGFASYRDTLNESFADVAAIVSLIKEHGKDNRDLQYVLKVIEAQRHDTYFHHDIGKHFSHFSVGELLTPSSRQKIDQISSGQQLRDFALSIANKGTQQMIAHKDTVATTMFAMQPLQLSTLVNTMKVIKEEALPHKAVGSPYADGIARGFSYDLAREIVSGLDLKKAPNLNNENVLFQYANNAVQSGMASATIHNKTAQYLQTMQELHSHLTQQYSQQLVDFDKPRSRQEVMSRIGQVRARFLEDSTKLQNAPAVN